jgi:hypothetical protein
MFATAARVSEINLSLYRTVAQPAVRMLGSSPWAEWLQRCHPLRLQYELFSDANPFMAPFADWADQVRKDRRPAAAGNPFIAMQEAMSRQIVAGLDAARKISEAAAERTFLSIYGWPTLQAAVGVDSESAKPLRKADTNFLHQELVRSKIAELKADMTKGGLRECVVRAGLYVSLARGCFDERGFETVRRIRNSAHQHRFHVLPLPEFKQLIREQFFMLLIDEQHALAAIPSMLPANADERRQAVALLRKVMSARGELDGEPARRMERVVKLFEERPLAVVPPPPRDIDETGHRSRTSRH